MANVFQVGDVVASRVSYGPVLPGDLGTICSVSGHTLGVNWRKEHSSFHSCSGACEVYHGYYMYHPITLLLIRPFAPPPPEGDDWI